MKIEMMIIIIIIIIIIMIVIIIILCLQVVDLVPPLRRNQDHLAWVVVSSLERGI